MLSIWTRLDLCVWEWVKVLNPNIDAFVCSLDKDLRQHRMSIPILDLFCPQLLHNYILTISLVFCADFF